MFARSLAVVLGVVVACSCSGGAEDGGVDAGGNVERDAGSVDAGAIDGGTDAGTSDGGSADGGALDAGVGDAGAVDAGAGDAGPVDGGLADAGAMDSGVDGGATDAGSSDAGAPDGGFVDAGALDAGAADAGSVDAGSVDAGSLDAGPADAGALDAGVAGCGDGVVQPSRGEQCDLAAANGLDAGCSALCALTRGLYRNETEPNDGPGMGNTLAGYAGAVGQLSSGTDVDSFAVSVTVAGSSIVAALSDGFGRCPAFASRLRLLSPSSVVLATDLDGGVAPCSEVSGVRTAAARNLAVGTYVLTVESSVGAPQGSYVLDVRVSPPGCGDGILQGGEQCDPGPVSNAACSSGCAFTSNFMAEQEPNGTTALANSLNGFEGAIGGLSPAGDQDYFSFSVSVPNAVVWLQVGDGLGGCPAGFDSRLTLFEPNNAVRVTDDNGGPGSCSAINPLLTPLATGLAAGVYRARVEVSGNLATVPLYVLSVSVRPPGCGNGFVEAGEQCDEGQRNGVTGSGCGPTCAALAPWELEPNGSTATASPPWSGQTSWKGRIAPVGDRDYFSFDLTASATVTLTTHDVDAPGLCTSDTVVHLLNATGTELTSDDDSGPGPGVPGGGRCSRAQATALPAGRYYAWVQRAGDAGLIVGYQLDVTAQ